MSKRDEIVQFLITSIDNGTYTDALPSEHELMREFDVSRLTARAALEQLANDGRIQSHQGRGWFVRPDNRLTFPLLQLRQGKALVSNDIWRDWLASQHLQGDSSLVTTQIPPPEHIREHLELAPGDLCVARRRVREVQSHPVMISTAYFPLWAILDTWLARGEETNDQDISPLGLLRRLGMGPVHEHSIVGARRPAPDEETVLQLGRGIPVLTNCRISRTRDGEPVRCTADVLAGDQFYLTIDQRHSEEPE